MKFQTCEVALTHLTHGYVLPTFKFVATNISMLGMVSHLHTKWPKTNGVFLACENRVLLMSVKQNESMMFDIYDLKPKVARMERN